MVELREQIHALGLLQEIDSRIDRLTEESRNLPEKIAQVEARVAKAKGDLEAAQAGVEELRSVVARRSASCRMARRDSRPIEKRL